MSNETNPLVRSERSNRWFRAINEDDVLTVWDMIREGFDLETTNIHAQTAIFIAACRQRIGLVKILHESGANIHVTEPRGQTLLIVAFLGKSLPMIEWALAAGVSPSRCNKNGDTPLHYAATLGYASVVAELLACGADPAAVNSKGTTVLSTCKPNCLPVVEAAISAQALSHATQSVSAGSAQRM